MYEFVVIAMTAVITAGSFGFGYWLANYHREIQDLRWFQELTLEDHLSGTPIYNKMNREYGYEN